MRTGLSAAILALAAAPALAHRLDEYLQGTLLSVERNRIEAQMTLTPGVAVFPLLFASIDTDGNGDLSETEQRAYAGRVLRDLSLTIDGRRLTPRLLSLRFPAVAEMQEGRGEIQLDFDAELPDGGRNRQLILENRHQSRISAYQVNCLVPRDPRIRISAQIRNYSQSLYRLEYTQTEIGAEPLYSKLRSGGLGWLTAIALLLFTRLVILWRRGSPARGQLV